MKDACIREPQASLATAQAGAGELPVSPHVTELIVVVNVATTCRLFLVLFFVVLRATSRQC